MTLAIFCLNAHHTLSAAAPHCVRRLDRSGSAVALNLPGTMFAEVTNANADHVGVLYRTS